MLLYQFGLPVGSTVLVAASEPGGSSGFGLSERREGVCSEAPGMFPVWTESSIQVEKQSVLIKKKIRLLCTKLTTTAKSIDLLTELILASSASSA